VPAHDPLDLESGPAQQRKREKSEALATREELNDIAWLMANKRGRRVVWRWLEYSGVFRTSFSTEALEMAMREGQRNHGLRLLAQIHERCPGSYQLMVQEQQDDRPDKRDGQRDDDGSGASSTGNATGGDG